jgi:hypothetical protein
MGKEEDKLSLFANKMIIHLDSPKNSTKRLLELISKFNKVAQYKNHHTKISTFSIHQ